MLVLRRISPEESWNPNSVLNSAVVCWFSVCVWSLYYRWHSYYYRDSGGATVGAEGTTLHELANSLLDTFV